MIISTVVTIPVPLVYLTDLLLNVHSLGIGWYSGWTNRGHPLSSSILLGVSALTWAIGDDRRIKDITLTREPLKIINHIYGPRLKDLRWQLETQLSHAAPSSEDLKVRCACVGPADQQLEFVVYNSDRAPWQQWNRLHHDEVMPVNLGISYPLLLFLFLPFLFLLFLILYRCFARYKMWYRFLTLCSSL